MDGGVSELGECDFRGGGVVGVARLGEQRSEAGDAGESRVVVGLKAALRVMACRAKKGTFLSTRRSVSRRSGRAESSEWRLCTTDGTASLGSSGTRARSVCVAAPPRDYLHRGDVRQQEGGVCAREARQQRDVRGNHRSPAHLHLSLTPVPRFHDEVEDESARGLGAVEEVGQRAAREVGGPLLRGGYCSARCAAHFPRDWPGAARGRTSAPAARRPRRSRRPRRRWRCGDSPRAAKRRATGRAEGGLRGSEGVLRGTDCDSSGRVQRSSPSHRYSIVNCRYLTVIYRYSSVLNRSSIVLHRSSIVSACNSTMAIQHSTPSSRRSSSFHPSALRPFSLHSALPP